MWKAGEKRFIKGELGEMYKKEKKLERMKILAVEKNTEKRIKINRREGDSGEKEDNLERSDRGKEDTKGKKEEKRNGEKERGNSKRRQRDDGKKNMKEENGKKS